MTQANETEESISVEWNEKEFIVTLDSTDDKHFNEVPVGGCLLESTFTT